VSLLKKSTAARPTGLTAALVLCLLAAAALAPQRAAACSLLEPEVCVETNSGGVATINVPPLSIVASLKPEVKEFEDCIWEAVEVDFGDGSPIEVVYWDASKGLSGSHAFPGPGEYHVQIETNEGWNADSATKPPASCPDLVIKAKVIYPTPPPPREEAPPPKPPTEREEEKPSEREGPSKGSGGGGGGGGGSGSGQGPVQTQPAGGNGYWHGCAGSVYAHRVGCHKARTVIGVARSRLTGHRAVRVAGFRCRLDRDPIRPVSCRRGAQRAIGPDSA
jgi:hypothetical protein